VNAQRLKVANLVAVVLWGLNFPLLLVQPIRDSVGYVAFCSVYANFVGHISAWQAARSEQMADPEQPNP
jgi:hypothetical protein